MEYRIELDKDFLLVVNDPSRANRAIGPEGYQRVEYPEILHHHSLFVRPQSELPHALSLSLKMSSCGIQRDFLGLTPLFYREISGDSCWACSSKPDLLKNLHPFLTELDEEIVGGYALNTQSFSFADGFFWKGIRRVPAGAHLTLSASTAPRVQHVSSPLPTTPPRSPAHETFTQLLERAVSATPPDAILMLSSGTDSTLMAMLHPAQRVRTASLVFPDHPACDEAAEIHRICDVLGMRSFDFDTRPHMPLQPESLALYARSLEYGPPMHPGESYELAFLAAASRHYGTPHFVSGMGADQLMHVPFYWVLRQLLMLEPQGEQVRQWHRWMGTPTIVRHQLRVLGPRDPVIPSDAHFERQIRAQLPDWAHPDYPLAGLVRGLRRLNDASLRSHESFAHHMMATQAWESMAQTLARRATLTSTSTHRPFLDEALWRFRLSLPSSLMHGFRPQGSRLLDKLLLRQAHASLGRLPEEIAWREKMAVFEDFIHDALLKARGIITDLLTDMRLHDMGVVDERRAQQFFQSVCGLSSAALRSKPHAPRLTSLWSILATEMWVRNLESGGKRC